MTCPRRHFWSMSELEFESRPSALQVTPFPSHHLVSLRGGWQPSTETPGWKQRVETALMKGESEPGRAPRAGSSSARAPGGAEERGSQPSQQLITGFTFSFPSFDVSEALIKGSKLSLQGRAAPRGWRGSRCCGKRARRPTHGPLQRARASRAAESVLFNTDLLD